MNFKEQSTLLVDENPNGSHEVSIDDSLLIGDVIYSWDGDTDEYGYHDYCMMPCYLNGKKSFLKRWSWCPRGIYSASGEGEAILTFEEGVKLLLEHGAYDHIFKEN